MLALFVLTSHVTRAIATPHSSDGQNGDGESDDSQYRLARDASAAVIAIREISASLRRAVRVRWFAHLFFPQRLLYRLFDRLSDKKFDDVLSDCRKLRGLYR